MKHMKKILALMLVLCFMAVIPLSASASSSYDTYVIGNWTAYEIYDSDTGVSKGVEEGACLLYVYSDGTAKLVSGTTIYPGRWSYSRTDSSGYWFTFNISTGNGSAPVEFVYMTYGGYEGFVILYLVNYQFIFQKA